MNRITAASEWLSPAYGPTSVRGWKVCAGAAANVSDKPRGEPDNSDLSVVSQARRAGPSEGEKVEIKSFRRGAKE